MKNKKKFVIIGLIGISALFLDFKLGQLNGPKERPYYTLQYTKAKLEERVTVMQYAIDVAGKVGPSNKVDLVRDSLAAYINSDIRQYYQQYAQDSIQAATKK